MTKQQRNAPRSMCSGAPDADAVLQQRPSRGRTLSAGTHHPQHRALCPLLPARTRRGLPSWRRRHHILPQLEPARQHPHQAILQLHMCRRGRGRGRLRSGNVNRSRMGCAGGTSTAAPVAGQVGDACDKERVRHAACKAGQVCRGAIGLGWAVNRHHDHPCIHSPSDAFDAPAQMPAPLLARRRRGCRCRGARARTQRRPRRSSPCRLSLRRFPPPAQPTEGEARRYRCVCTRPQRPQTVHAQNWRMIASLKTTQAQQRSGSRRSGGGHAAHLHADAAPHVRHAVAVGLQRAPDGGGLPGHDR